MGRVRPICVVAGQAFFDVNFTTLASKPQ